MKALKSRAAVIAGAILASSAMLVPLAAPAGAATVVDGCSFTTNPASGGSQSALRVACNFPTAASVPASNVISDFSNAQWHNGAAKAVNGVAYDGGLLLGNLTVVASPNAHFTAADTNHQISGTIGGTAIGAYTNIKVVLSANAVALNMPATSTGVSGKVAADAIVVDAKVENSSIRAGVGAVTTPGTCTEIATPNTCGMVISPTLGFSSPADIDRSIDGTPLSTSAKILSTGTVTAGISTAITGSSTALAGYSYAYVSGTTVASSANLSSTPAYPNQISVGADEVVSTARLLSINSSADEVNSSQSGVKFTKGTVSSASTKGTGKVTFAANAPASFVGATITSASTNITSGSATIVQCSLKDCWIDKVIPTGASLSTTATIFKASPYQVDAANGKILGPEGTFRASDIGLPVGGCGIYSGANGTNTVDSSGQNYITAVSPSGSSATLAGGAYGTGLCSGYSAYGINVSIGLASNSAPTNGDVMSIISSTLNLSPALVPGSDACSAGTYEGTTITGQWFNPTSIGASLGGQQSVSLSSSFVPAAVQAPSNTIGGIKYPTAVVSFWAFVSLRTSSETISTNTFEKDTAKITLPWVPTLLALCADTGISSEYLFSGTSIGTQTIPTGTGRPSTALRGLKKRANNSSGLVAYQPTTAAGVASIWIGSGSFEASGSLGQGVTAKLTKK